MSLIHSTNWILNQGTSLSVKAMDTPHTFHDGSGVVFLSEKHLKKTKNTAAILLSVSGLWEGSRKGREKKIYHEKKRKMKKKKKEEKRKEGRGRRAGREKGRRRRNRRRRQRRRRGRGGRREADGGREGGLGGEGKGKETKEKRKKQRGKKQTNVKTRTGWGNSSRLLHKSLGGALRWEEALVCIPQQGWRRRKWCHSRWVHTETFGSPGFSF